MYKQRAFLLLLFISFTALFLTGCCQDTSPHPWIGYGYYDPHAPRQKIIAALEHQPHVTVIQQGDRVKIILPSDCYFINQTAQITQKAEPALHIIADLLNTYRNITVTVAVYTDNIGRPEKKQSITNAQAHAVASYLWAYGVARDRLRAVGYADKHPVAKNTNADSAKLNRRIVICINPWGCC